MFQTTNIYKEIQDSLGLHAVDSGFLIFSNLDSGFLEPYPGLQGPGFRITLKNSPGFGIPQSRFPYRGRKMDFGLLFFIILGLQASMFKGHSN